MRYNMDEISSASLSCSLSQFCLHILVFPLNTKKDQIAEEQVSSCLAFPFPTRPSFPAEGKGQTTHAAASSVSERSISV